VTWVKICGITTMEARDAAVEAGADAIGFVVDPSSPRYVEPDLIARFCDGIDIERFIVSVDRSPEWLVDLASEVGATGIQNHGQNADEAAAAALGSGLRALRPIPVGDAGITVDPGTVPSGAIPLFDTVSHGSHGGTGRSFPWDTVAGVHAPFVLAGGLGVDNVARAIALVRPWGVDASSRLEVARGRKDPDTIRSFVREVRIG